MNISTITLSCYVEGHSESLLSWDTDPVESPLKMPGAVDIEMNEQETTGITGVDKGPGR